MPLSNYPDNGVQIGSDTIHCRRTANADTDEVVLGNDTRLTAPAAHAASHTNGGADEVATATPAANAIPKALGTGYLSSSWLAVGTGAGQIAAGNDSRFGSSYKYPLVEVTSNNTTSQVSGVTQTLNCIVVHGSQNHTIQLNGFPASPGGTAFWFTNLSSGDVTITTRDGETINGQASYVLRGGGRRAICVVGTKTPTPDDWTVLAAFRETPVTLAVTSITSAAGTTAIAATDHVVVVTGTTTHALTLVACATGRQLILKNRSTGTVTVNRAGSDTIDGATSYSLLAGQAITLVGNGTDWVIV